MRVYAVDIVHQHPFFLSDALPHVRCLASTVLAVDLFGVIIVEMVDFIANHVLDAARILLGHIAHKVSPVGHGTDICIEHLNLIVGILKQQFGLGLKGCKLLVGVAII